MKISSTSAQQIVEEIGKLVRQNINLMDETGHIIASNDPGRIGKFHPGAFDVLTNHLTELYITQEWELSDNRVRQGINLPIEVDGHPEGVIGITGLYEEVIQYGQIVKKMAEILIRERIALDAQRLDQRIRTRFLEEWILGDGLANLQSLSERGVALGIDIRLSRRCVVVSPQNLAGYQNSLEGQSFLEQVESVVSAQLPQGAMVLRNTGRQVLILPASSSRELIRLCQKITDAVSKQLGIQMVWVLMERQPIFTALFSRPSGLGVMPVTRPDTSWNSIPSMRNWFWTISPETARSVICGRYFPGAAYPRSGNIFPFWMPGLRQKAPSPPLPLLCIFTKTHCSTV